MGCHRKVDCAGSDTTKAEKQSLTCAGGGPPRLIAVIGRPGGVHLHLLARRHSARSGAHGGVLSRSPTLLRCGRPARRYNRDRCRLRALRELRGARAEHARSTRRARAEHARRLPKPVPPRHAAASHALPARIEGLGWTPLGTRQAAWGKRATPGGVPRLKNAACPEGLRPVTWQMM